MSRDYKDAVLCVNCRMSQSALLLRLTGVGRIVLLSVKNKLQLLVEALWNMSTAVEFFYFLLM